MKPRWITSTGRLVAVAVSRLVRFFDYLTWDGLLLGALAGLASIALLTLCHGCHQSLVENHVIRKSNAACASSTKECRELVLEDEITDVRFVEWMSATTPGHNAHKAVDVLVVVKEADPGTLHRSEPLNGGIIIGKRGPLCDIPLRNILHELLPSLKLAEDRGKDGRNQERDNADDDAPGKVGSGISEDHINFLANVKVIASPLARASVDCRNEVIITKEHRKQRASGDCYPRVVRIYAAMNWCSSSPMSK